MRVETFYNNPFQEACYIVYPEVNDVCVIIDCGAYRPQEEERIRRFIAEQGLRPVAHLLTHAHLDHCFGARFIYEEYGLLPVVPDADIPLYHQLQEQAELFGIRLCREPLEECKPLSEWTDKKVRLVSTPGHTPGGTCYYYAEEGVLFSGDTLFEGGYGRTDLPGGDFVELMQSLKKLGTLPKDTCVYPGHGYPTTIGREGIG